VVRLVGTRGEKAVAEMENIAIVATRAVGRGFLKETFAVL
jgi:hypothetical protein